tara:strand:- start:230 stop:532 length:303 start_codon:yes stop_codon:yes gene_type:complete
MKSVKYARRANTDLEDITDYTAQTWGVKQAKKYNKSIRSMIQSIARGEDTLQALNVQRANIYKARVNRHLIIFEQNVEEIRIIRVLHEAMDIPRHIKLDS